MEPRVQPSTQQRRTEVAVGCRCRCLSRCRSRYCQVVTRYLTYVAVPLIFRCGPGLRHDSMQPRGACCGFHMQRRSPAQYMTLGTIKRCMVTLAIAMSARRLVAVSSECPWVSGCELAALVYKLEDKKETRISLRKRQDDGGGYISRRTCSTV